MKKILLFKRPFIWIKRFRKRCGYGVHSPSAFDFITTVIYEREQYYAYSDIKKAVEYKDIKAGEGRAKKTKINHLLFRLVNRTQPQVIVEMGSPTTTTCYLKAAKRDVEYFSTSTKTSEPQTICQSIYQEKTNFLFIHYAEDPDKIRKVIELCLPKLNKKSILVIEGICYDSSMKQLWKEIQDNKHAIVTYDLYDLGIVLFETGKTKQHYKVNF
jgi:hypothetical protein